jgi:hypothetical protein
MWMAACISVPIYAFVNRDLQDTDIVVISAMLILTVPVGIAFVGLMTLIVIALEVLLGDIQTSGFVFNLAIWVPMTMLGYAQWFLLLPALFRRD